MWIETRGRQHRVYWRTGLPSPKKAFEPFPSRDAAELFIDLARRSGTLSGALGYVRDPRPDTLRELLGLAPLSAPAEQPPVGAPATAGAGAPCGPVGFGVTFERLWERFLAEQRHLEGTTGEDYASYGRHHLLPFFGPHDVALIRRARPLRESDATAGAVYVDDFLEAMLAKERLNNVGRPVRGSLLSIKFIKNVMTVLAQCFDFAIAQRPAPIEVNPARGIRLPKQDRREMHFVQDADAYHELRDHMHAHFRPLLDFLVGTGARYGEAAGLLVRHVHLDVARPYVDIRIVLKWVGRKWKLGRPKTRSSVRRISLSPKLVQVLRPLVEGRDADAHVFTMVEGGPLHHGNFRSRYFKAAVEQATARVPKKLRIHDLRHTHAAWLISDGAPLYVVQRRLGHSTSVTTQDVYGHLTDESDDRTLALVDRRLPSVLSRDDEGAEVLRLSTEDQRLPEFDVDDDDDLAA
jgi:integrase